MCASSAIMDNWINRHPQYVMPAVPWPGATEVAPVTRFEFNALRAEIEALKKLLLAANEFDAATGQPDCEMAEKVEVIKQIAKIVGVDFDKVFANHK